MFATTRRYEGVTDATEAGRLVNEAFLPIVSAIPGFVVYYWVDAGGGVMISASIFDSREGAEESTRQAAAFVREKLARLLPNPPRVTTGEVVAYKAA